MIKINAYVIILWLFINDSSYASHEALYLVIEIEELLAHIIDYIDIKDCLHLSQTATFFHDHIKDQKIWLIKLVNHLASCGYVVSRLELKRWMEHKLLWSFKDIYVLYHKLKNAHLYIDEYEREHFSCTTKMIIAQEKLCNILGSSLALLGYTIYAPSIMIGFISFLLLFSPIMVIFPPIVMLDMIILISSGLGTFIGEKIIDQGDALLTISSLNKEQRLVKVKTIIIADFEKAYGNLPLGIAFYLTNI